MDTTRDPANDDPAQQLASDRESLHRLRETIERAPIGIAHFNGAGRFLLVNERLCRILGRSRAELLSTTFQSITHPEDLEECVAQNERVARGEVPSYTMEKRFVDADGHAVWARVSVSAVRDAHGALSFFIGVAEDVTERHEAERALRARDESHSIAAHELRRRLDAISASIERLRQADDAALRARELDAIAQGAAAMARLLDYADRARTEPARGADTRTRAAR